MSRNKRWILLLVCLCVLLPGGLAESDNLISGEMIQVNAANYETHTVEIGVYDVMTSASGTVVYPYTYDLRFDKEGAKFGEYLVKRGTKVKKGDPLISFILDIDEVELERQRLELTRAREELERQTESRQEQIEEMVEGVYSTDDRFEREKLNLQVTRAEIEMAQFIELQQMHIRDLEDSIAKMEQEASENMLLAPIDGEIINLAYKRDGDLVYTSEVLVTICRTDKMLMRVENKMDYFRYGMEVDVEIGVNDERRNVSGRVVGADTLLSDNLRTRVAYIELEGVHEDTDLRKPQVRGSAFYLGNVITVPRDGVKFDNGKSYVTKLVDGLPRKRYVNRVVQNNAQLWILQGLEPGETIVID